MTLNHRGSQKMLHNRIMCRMMCFYFLLCSDGAQREEILMKRLMDFRWQGRMLAARLMSLLRRITMDIASIHCCHANCASVRWTQTHTRLQTEPNKGNTHTHAQIETIHIHVKYTSKSDGQSIQTNTQPHTQWHKVSCVYAVEWMVRLWEATESF